MNMSIRDTMMIAAAFRSPCADERMLKETKMTGGIYLGVMESCHTTRLNN
jgi:hypothetical protein